MKGDRMREEERENGNERRKQPYNNVTTSAQSNAFLIENCCTTGRNQSAVRSELSLMRPSGGGLCSPPLSAFANHDNKRRKQQQHFLFYPCPVTEPPEFHCGSKLLTLAFD
jgi:hypothetical protein